MQNLTDIILELNCDLYENNTKLVEEYGVQYSYSTNGDMEIIEFLGVAIFNSEFQETDKETDNDIPVTVEYLKSKTTELLSEINKGL